MLRSRISCDDCRANVTEEVDRDCGRELEYWCRKHPGVVVDVSGPGERGREK